MSNNIFIQIYNQTLERFTRNGCTIYTQYMIIQLQWGIRVSNDFIVNTLKLAERDKKWYETWGAYFAEIYTWFILKIKERTGVVLEIKTISILSKEFETLYNNGYAFGLGLKIGNNNYINFSADGELSKDDIDGIVKMGGGFQHNHTYYKGTAFDTVGTLKDQSIKISLENLKYAVKKGMYFENARTFIMKDKLLEKYLKDYMNGRVTQNMQDLPDINIKAIEKASSLRIFKK